MSRVEAKREAQRAKGNEENSPSGIELGANKFTSAEPVFHGASCKAAKDEAKPDCSEQLATGSSSVYGLQDTKQ